MSLLWLGVFVGVLLLVTGLRVLGARRWTQLIRNQTRQLESARVDVQSPAQGHLPSPAHYDERELEGLPAPVQRYFRAVLTDRQRIIGAASIDMAGTINMFPGMTARVGKDMVMLPWDCALSDDQAHDGMVVPMTGEAAWLRPQGRKAYFVGHVKTLSYEFLP